MKIVKSLSPQGIASGYSALIQVEPDEIADCEEMLKLLDGDTVGNFGLTIELVATDKEPTCQPALYAGKPIGPGYLIPQKQFGFPCASILEKRVRFYSCIVHRD